MNRVQSDSYWYDVGYKTAKKETVDRMLEIIDTIDAECDKDVLAGNSVDLDEVFARLHNGVLALKGEHG